MSQARLLSERRFHDLQAAQRARDLQPFDYFVDDNTYLSHESWITSAFDMLGDVKGRRILDLGCGHGMASVVLARRGARVTACDLSLGYLKEARRRAQVNEVQITQILCNGERLPFADASFDRIWGNAILHHLHLPTAARELHRVLTPDGIAVFCEPWGGNRWLTWARQSIPYPGKHRTADETPLQSGDLAHFRAFFPTLQVRGFQLLSMLGRVLRLRCLVSGLAWCDKKLLSGFPGWQRYCRYVVLTMHKP